MTIKRITGVLSPVVTPFKADLSPNAEQFVRQCRWLSSQNVGLAVFGTNSEANSLGTEEKIELLDRLGHASSKANDGGREPASRPGWAELPSSAPVDQPLPRSR